MMQGQTESHRPVPPHWATQKEVDEMYQLLRKWGVDPGDEGRAKWIREGGLFWIGRRDAEGRQHGVIVAMRNGGGVLYQGRAFHGCPTGFWRQIATGEGWVLSMHRKPAEGWTDSVTRVPFDKRGVQAPRLPVPAKVPIIAEDIYYPSEAELADMDSPEFAEREFTVNRVCYGPGGSISTYREEIVEGKSLRVVCIPFLSGTPRRPHGRSYSFHAPGPNGEQGPLWMASWHVWPDITSRIETFDPSGRSDDELLFSHCERPVRCKVQHPGRKTNIFRDDCDCQDLEGGYGARMSRSDIPDWALRPADPAAAMATAEAFPCADDLYDIKTMPDGSRRITCAEWHQP